jgi:phospholipid-binding lipoprotein MlaA
VIAPGNATVTTALATLLLTFLLGACANVPPEQRVDSDPWEPLNRPLYSVNDAIDKVSLKPIAKAYEKVLPRPARTGITNFMKNLITPQSALNNFLQGKPAYGFSELGRFLFNSTVGIGGLFDVATASGLEPHREDIGQTAAVWGVPDGPYVMVPFFGPQTLRDAVLLPVHIVSNLLYHYDNSSVRDKLYILRAIELRERLLTVDKLLEDSKDPYITLRETYLQNREYQIYDGDPPEDDEFFDEFLEEDD